LCLKKALIRPVPYIQDYDSLFLYIALGAATVMGRAPMGIGDTADSNRANGFVYQDTPVANRWDAGPVLVKMQPYLKSEQIGFCPSVEKVNPDLSANTNYEASAYLFADTAKEDQGLSAAPYRTGKPIHATIIVDPSNTMVLQDYKGTNSRPHFEGFNNLAADDRVKWMKSGSTLIKPRYW